ncbi:DgyrCDS1926 [Dimorphilus gyrociliatus]|uniref:DgyrCDS1926 n=1 Tax=Dimorphilus gyrociliatus TaxID=2664684 RepID=A0A7I8VDU4_9ANNE|nr:DgyrCDS1926 [Dimorphilus gyrociliatus]
MVEGWGIRLIILLFSLFVLSRTKYQKEVRFHELEGDRILLKCPESGEKCRILGIELRSDACHKTLISIPTKSNSCHISAKVFPFSVQNCTNMRQNSAKVHYKCISKDDPVKIWSYCYNTEKMPKRISCSTEQNIQLKKVTISESTGGDLDGKPSCLPTKTDWSYTDNDLAFLDPFLCDGFSECSSSMKYPRQNPIIARKGNYDSYHVISYISIEYLCVNNQKYRGNGNQKVWVCNPHKFDEMKVTALTINTKNIQCLNAIDLNNPIKKEITDKREAFIRLFITAKQHLTHGSGKEYCCSLQPNSSKSMKASFSSISHYGSRFTKDANRIDIIPEEIQPNDGYVSVNNLIRICYISNREKIEIMQSSFLYVTSSGNLKIQCQSVNIGGGHFGSRSTVKTVNSMEFTTNKQTSNLFTQSFNNTKNSERNIKTFSLSLEILIVLVISIAIGLIIGVSTVCCIFACIRSRIAAKKKRIAKHVTLPNLNQVCYQENFPLKEQTATHTIDRYRPLPRTREERPISEHDYETIPEPSDNYGGYLEATDFQSTFLRENHIMDMVDNPRYLRSTDAVLSMI